MVYLRFKAYQPLYVPPGLTLKNYVVITLRFNVFSEETATFALCNINSLVFITEAESVYCEVRTEFLYNTDTFRI
jgi:hypothetical protein